MATSDNQEEQPIQRQQEIHEHIPHRAAHKEQNPMTNWIYDVFLWTFSILVDLFFREVHPRGSWKVPRRGPLIFVAAPHANQVCLPNIAYPHGRQSFANSRSLLILLSSCALFEQNVTDEQLSLSQRSPWTDSS